MPSELLHIQNLFKKLCKQPIYEFPKPREALHASDKQGVYVIMNSKNRVVHVGRTPRAKHGIYQRIKNHLYGNSSFTYYYLSGKGSKLRYGYRYRYLEIKDPRKRALLESYAIAHLCPLHIGLGDE